MYAAVHMQHSFGKHTEIEVRTNISHLMPKDKTLAQLQAELWQAVADDALKLADQYRGLSQSQTIQEN